MKTILLTSVLALSVFASNTSIIKVEAMHCPLCTTAVKKAIKKVDGIEKVSAKLNTKEVTVTYDNNVSLKQILDAIKTTSYEGKVISTSKDK